MRHTALTATAKKTGATGIKATQTVACTDVKPFAKKACSRAHAADYTLASNVD